MSARINTAAERARLDGLTGHTGGPWWTDSEYCEDEGGIPIIAARTDCGPLPGNPTRGMVAWARELLPENISRCEADARLIAAAPDLLVGYRAALDEIDRLTAALAEAEDRGAAQMRERAAGKAARTLVAMNPQNIHAATCVKSNIRALSLRDPGTT